jgi:hypothetical protein
MHINPNGVAHDAGAGAGLRTLGEAGLETCDTGRIHGLIFIGKWYKTMGIKRDGE